MAQSIVIAVPAYLMKRGISAVIHDIVQAEIIYIDGMDELNHYLESNPVEAIFIDEAFLGNKDERDLFFQLKHQARCFALSENPQTVPARQRFQAIIEKNTPNQKLQPLLENHLSLDTEQTGARRSVLSERIENGWMEGGTFRENSFMTGNIGFGFERFVTGRWSFFAQPTYQHTIYSFNKGFGPTNDRMNTLSIYTGIRIRMKR